MKSWCRLSAANTQALTTSVGRASAPTDVLFEYLESETYPLRIMLRSTAFFGFILTGVGSLLPWFRWETVIGGREAFFAMSALDIADRGETIFVFAVVGGTVVSFAKRATPMIIPVLAAAMSLIVVLYTRSNPLPLPGDMVMLEGFYVTLSGTVIALIASTVYLLEGLRSFPPSKAQ